MSERIHRMLRKSAQAASQNAARQMAPAVTAALQNEELTRKRVDALEAHAKDVDSMFQRSFFGRLRWLIRGL